MTDSEKLNLIITEIQGMKTDMQDMKTDMQDMKTDMQDMKIDMQGMNSRIDNLELHMKQMERNLKNEIHKECALVLDEVERVHRILDEHKSDKKAHSA